MAVVSSFLARHQDAGFEDIHLGCDVALVEHHDIGYVTEIGYAERHGLRFGRRSDGLGSAEERPVAWTSPQTHTAPAHAQLDDNPAGGGGRFGVLYGNERRKAPGTGMVVTRT